jgi:hypothetical protein
MPVTDPGRDDPAEQWCQLDQITMLELTEGLVSAQAQRSRRCSGAPGSETAPEGEIASIKTSELPGIRVMKGPAPSRYW